MAFALQNPEVAATTLQRATAPGQIDVQKMGQSVADFAIEALRCYHKTAKFRQVYSVGRNWSRQAQCGAEASVGLRVQYYGISGTPFSMEVILLVKPNQIRTVVASDTALVPHSKQCALENWITHNPTQ